MAPESSLTTSVTAHYRRLYGNPGESQIRAWRNSLTALARVVGKVDLDASGVGVELRLPSNNRRIDASFVARDSSGDPHVVLVELKQWETAAPSMNPDNVLVGGQEKLHPSAQVAAYADYLQAAHSAFTEHDFRLSACSYLHNMQACNSVGIRGLEYAGVLHQAPMFTADDEGLLTDYLFDRLEGGDGMALLPTLVKGRHSPSKKLIDGVARALDGQPMWTMIDEQRLAYNLVKGHVARAVATGEKATVIVVGGPGTGKSVIAVHLLVDLGRQYRVAHSTASKAFTLNLRAVGGRGAESLFCWNKDFAHRVTEENSLDVLIVDEAHRVRLTSNTRWTKGEARSSIPQANELIRAARISVFLLDEQQNVRPDEIGDVAAIVAAAQEEGVPVIRVELDAQFRCNGCEEYIEWVNALFTNSPVHAKGWLREGEYDVRLMDTPQALEDALLYEVNRGCTGRIVAGYCWPWSDPNPDGTLEPDVVIGGWRRPWNEKSPEQRTKKPGAAPKPARHPYTLWATQPKGLSEVGCIYSAQGFEFDYCAVILGNDLVWRDGVGWIASKDASCDPAIARRKHDPAELTALIQHTYRVLMTRGMLGTFVYSTDYETRQHLKQLTRLPATASAT